MNLTVVLSNFNHAQFLPDCLGALTSQTRAPDEIIVVDDGSTDKSVEIIQSFAARFPSIQLHRNDTNHGVAYSTERAMSLAKSEYIYFAAADDRVLPSFFEKSLDLMLRHPQAGISCSEPSLLDAATGRVSANRMRWSEKARFFSPHEFSEVLGGRYVAGNTGIVRLRAVAQVGGFHPQLRWHMDWFLNLALAFRFGLCYIPETLTLLRHSQDTMSSRGMNDRVEQTKVIKETFKLLRQPEYQDLLPYLARSQALRSLRPWVVPAYLEDPTSWDPRIQTLLQVPLAEWTAAALTGYQRKEHEIQIDSQLKQAMDLAKEALQRGQVQGAIDIYRGITDSVPDYQPARACMNHLLALTAR